MHQKIINEQFSSPVYEFLSESISVYRKGSSTNHDFIRLIETRRSALDNNIFPVAVLMNLSKPFDCIALDLLTSKLHVC